LLGHLFFKGNPKRTIKNAFGVNIRKTSSLSSYDYVSYHYKVWVLASFTGKIFLSFK
jgi:hypothetical protein